MHVSNVQCLQNVVRKDHLGDLGIDGRIILQWMGWLWTFQFIVSFEVLTVVFLKDPSLLRCYGILLGKWFPLFSKIVVPSSARVKQAKKTAGFSKVKAQQSFKTVATADTMTRCHIPEDLDVEHFCSVKGKRLDRQTASRSICVIRVLNAVTNIVYALASRYVLKTAVWHKHQDRKPSHPRNWLEGVHEAASWCSLCVASSILQHSSP